jgi:hypothetical protein
VFLAIVPRHFINNLLTQNLGLKRQRVRDRICPISGPGNLSASERKRRAKEIIEASGADTAEHFEKVVRSNHGVKFREQAEIGWNR